MLTLTSGASSLVVAPEQGAGVTGWMLGRTPMLRRALPRACIGGDLHAMGCLPLLPYCNRIGLAGFRWRGIDHQLKRNFGDHPHTIHGLGWQRAWSVMCAEPSFVALSLDHRADKSWPFGFHASVEYGLTQATLTVRIALTSRHDAPAPAGIGLHPFFPKAHDPALRFTAAGAWENGSDSLPLRHGPLPAAWCHAESRRVADSKLDNCFTDWNGSADIYAGPVSLRIEVSDVFRHLQVFTPSWADFFCLEPVSHVPDSLNRTDLPAEQAMHILRPGETLSGTIHLGPSG